MKRIRVWLLLFSFGPALGFISERIVKGLPAENGQFPYMVSIRKFGTHYCGGTIIGSRWVLTAAHCKTKPDDYTILAGTVSQKLGGREYSISEVLNHEAYDSVTLKNDIALLFTSEAFEFDDFVQPVKIGNAKELEKYTVLGWGTLDCREEQYPDVLQQVHLEVVPLKKCQTIYRRLYVPVPGEKQICAADPNWAGTCQGDSGGPLVSNRGYLVGLLSYGPSAQRIPDVFTRAYSYRDWIREHVNI